MNTKKLEKKKILIISGESSGEANAAQLIASMRKKNKDLDFYAVGGDACRKAGADVIFHIRNLGIVGLTAAVQKLPTLKRLRSQLLEFIDREKPDLIIPVDFPDFNLSLLNKIKNLRIPIVYFISPQVWAWRRGRVKRIKKLVRRIIVLLPFEEELYRNAGVDVVYVGNPAVERVNVTDEPAEFRKKYGIKGSKAIITFLPGSRFHEIDDIMPVMLKSVKLLKEMGDFTYVFAPADSVDPERVNKVLKDSKLENEVILAPAEAYNAARAASVVVTKSGTSTIEMALIGTPFIVVYKTTFLAYRLARFFYKKKEVSLVNIIGGGNTVPELIQRDFKPQKVAEKVMEIVENHNIRAGIIRYLKRVKERIGAPGAADRAADAVLEVLR